MAKHNYATVKAAARGQWRRILEHFGVAPKFLVDRHGPCPGCGGRDRFRFDGENGDGNFLCSQGKDGGGLLARDGFGLLEHCFGNDWKHWTDAVGDLLGCEPWRGDGSAASSGPVENAGVAPEPAAERVARPEVDREAVESYVRGVPVISEEWLARRSPIDPRTATTGDFLEALYRPGERLLVFTNERSQGDFLWEVGRGGFRLSQQRGVQATRSALPTAGPKGVWYLVQPVTGLWAIKPSSVHAPEARGMYSRRSKESVTCWRYFVLESDELSPELWLRVLAMIALPIAAIYTSGGRSIHALLRHEAATKEAWDKTRDVLRNVMSPLGADPNALTAVRLSRLPGCKRGDRLQRLLWLDPEPGMDALHERREVRA